jgi:hypothetical protein
MKVSKRKTLEIRALADASYEALLEVAKASKARHERRHETKAATTKSQLGKPPGRMAPVF